MWAGIPLAAVWLFSFAAAFHAIVEATGNGDDEVTTWPDANVLGWLAPALYVLAAAIISIAPGGLITGATLAASIENPAMAIFGLAAPPVLSGMVLFPFVYSSMLVEDNIMAIASPYTLRSLKIASDAWVFFYMYSILLVLLATAAVGMLIVENFVATAIGAVAFVAVAFVYARLLGRLMWVAAQRDAKHAG